MPHPRPRLLTAAEQYEALRANPLCEGEGYVRSGTLVWRYQVSPSAFGRIYSIRIDYRQGTRPEVYVESPDLVSLAEGKKLPHVYSQRPTRLCLYLPRQKEWSDIMWLDRTVVPWVSLWLLYFEDWLISGEWKGGGEHPSTANSKSKGPRAQDASGVP